MERQGSPLTQDLGEATKRETTIAKETNKADQAAARIGEKLGSAADTLRSKLPQEGRFESAARVVTNRLETSGTYLQEQGVTGAIQDLETLIRRYPIQAFLLGAGFGYVLSRLRAR
jgi:regulator of sirC expression with transglutaminase-like and TPR domain